MPGALDGVKIIDMSAVIAGRWRRRFLPIKAPRLSRSKIPASATWRAI